MAAAIWGVVVAAGRGTRFGGEKQLARIGVRTVVDMALDCLLSEVDGLVVVVPPELAGLPDPTAELGVTTRGAGARPRVVAGGATRAGSVRAGLAAVPATCGTVVVHDAARPLATRALSRAVLAAVASGADGAVPALPLTDTVKRVHEGQVRETLQREALVQVQTPQAFCAAALRSAHEGEPEATDDAGLVEAAGGRVLVVPGEPSNVKITTPADLELAEWWRARLATLGAASEGTGELARPEAAAVREGSR